jgi:hypothetical protein
MATKIKFYQRTSFLNCWNMTEHESIAMWKANLNQTDGVAIKSSAKNLRKALKKFTDNAVFVGEVEYINYDSESINDKKPLTPFVYKRNGFSHERELRAVVTAPPLDGYPDFKGKVHEQDIYLDWEGQEVGKHVDVFLDTLIDEIRISPSSPDWYLPLLKDAVQRYDYEIPVRESSLDVSPDVG